jgi:hypothetical protein
MKPSRVIAWTCAALTLVSAQLPPRRSVAAPAVADPGVASEIQPEAAKKAVAWLADSCKDARILYYADASKGGLLKVRARSELAPVLDVRLRRLRLAPVARVDARKAIYAIEFSPDVRRAAKRIGADLVGPLPYDAWSRQPDGSVIILGDLASGGPPKLDGELNDIAVEQALDQAAIGFEAVVVVGECRKPRQIDMVFWNG